MSYEIGPNSDSSEGKALFAFTKTRQDVDEIVVRANALEGITDGTNGRAAVLATIDDNPERLSFQAQRLIEEQIPKRNEYVWRLLGGKTVMVSVLPEIDPVSVVSRRGEDSESEADDSLVGRVEEIEVEFGHLVMRSQAAGELYDIWLFGDDRPNDPNPIKAGLQIID